MVTSVLVGGVKGDRVVMRRSVLALLVFCFCCAKFGPQAEYSSFSFMELLSELFFVYHAVAKDINRAPEAFLQLIRREIK